MSPDSPSAGGGIASRIDLSKYRLNPLPDENSDEDWDDDRELFGPDGRRSRPGGRATPTPSGCSGGSTRSSKRRLQIELLKLQDWVKDTGQKLVVVFEGRDAAGKGGTIKRFTEHLNPRGARVVALDKPTRARAHPVVLPALRRSTCPPAGEIVLFDRSWYNRAGVERVMGYCTDGASTSEFMRAGARASRRCWSTAAST